MYMYIYIYRLFVSETGVILAPHPEIKLARPELEGKLLTTELPGKSLDS